MRRRSKILFGVVTLLLSLVAVLMAALLTESGLHVALQLVQRAAPGTLSWQQASGRLIGPLQLDGIEYQDAAGHYRLGRLDFDWAPGRLLARRLSIHQLHVNDLEIVLPAKPDKVDAQPIEPGWRLPLEIVVRDLAVNRLRITTGAGEPVLINVLSGAANTGLEWLDIEQLQLDMPQLKVSVQGRLGLGRQMATALMLDWSLAPAGYAPIQATGQLKGTWDEAVLTQQFSAPLAAEARIEIQQPFAELRWALELNAPVTLLTEINKAWPAEMMIR